MNSKNDKLEILSDTFKWVFRFIGIIVGIIVFNSIAGRVIDDYSEESDLINSIIMLLSSPYSAFVGGGIGFLAGGLIGKAIGFIVTSIVGFIWNIIELGRKRKEQKRAIRKIKRANKNIDADIRKLNSLRKQITVDYRAVIANYNLCTLLGSLVENESSLMKCSLYCAEKYQILLNIREIEKRIELLAKQYEAIGDTKNTELYLSKIR